MKQTKQQFTRGIWTPWAEVLCLDCHGTKVADKPMKPQVVDELKEIRTGKPGDDHGLTHCDRCGKLIAVREEVANEHNLVMCLRENGINAKMVQTGGMCSGCEISLKDNGYLLATNGDVKGDDFLLARYTKDGEWDENLSSEIKTKDEVLAIAVSWNAARI